MAKSALATVPAKREPKPILKHLLAEREQLESLFAAIAEQLQPTDSESASVAPYAFHLATLGVEVTQRIKFITSVVEVYA